MLVFTWQSANCITASTLRPPRTLMQRSVCGGQARRPTNRIKIIIRGVHLYRRDKTYGMLLPGSSLNHPMKGYVDLIPPRTTILGYISTGPADGDSTVSTPDSGSLMCPYLRLSPRMTWPQTCCGWISMMRNRVDSKVDSQDSSGGGSYREVASRTGDVLRQVIDLHSRALTFTNVCTLASRVLIVSSLCEIFTLIKDTYHRFSFHETAWLSMIRVNSKIFRITSASLRVI